MIDHNVAAADRYFDSQEDSATRACWKAAQKCGLTAEEAENCDDGEMKCPTCPWAKYHINQEGEGVK